MSNIYKPKGLIFLLLSLVLCQPFSIAQTNENNDSTIIIEKWMVSDPVTMLLPAFHEQNNLKGKTFKTSDLLKSYPLSSWMKGSSTADESVSAGIKDWNTHNSSDNGDLNFKVDQNSDISLISQIAFVRTEKWVKLKIAVETRQCFEFYLNGKKKLSSYKFTANDKDPKKKDIELSLEPGKHLLLIRSLFKKDSGNDWSVNTKLIPVDQENKDNIVTDVSSSSFMDIPHLLHGKQMQSVSISPGGDFLLIQYKETSPPEGNTNRWAEVIDINTGELIYTSNHSDLYNFEWVPNKDALSYLANNDKEKQLIVYDINSRKEKVLHQAKDAISNYQWADDGTFIIFSKTEKPEKDKSGVKKLEGMPDRWPWWQSRGQLFKLDASSLAIQRLTYGHINNRLLDIHPDGSRILLTQNIPDFSKRPYSKQYLIEMSLADNSLDTVWVKNFSGSAKYSPDGKKLLVRGSPAMFGDKGTNLKKGQIPNDYDTQAYIYNLDDKGVEAISRDFNPSVEQAIWSSADGLIYFLAEDSTYKRIYSYNPETKDYVHLNAKTDVVKSISVAKSIPAIAYAGNSISYPTSAFVMNGKTHTLVADPEKAFFEDVEFGKTEDWAFTAKGGNSIDGRIYFPPDFDPQKKYPMIVYYYGGTSPTDRSFRGRYPKNLFAAMGYVVFVLQPSGATGYGQEFSARHVNNWGITVADEIIDGTKQFLKEHAFADPDRVGCIGASYGGFMTMLLTTRTDIFSAAIAHAGISSISSYWGEGYWGYLYSSAASANSFPWNNKEMYVEQSPLFSADKVNTPLLLLTGGADTNVPPGESLQFYTALKLLGKDAELIEIEGENHHILEYKKRIIWQKTIFAWFDKWLKGEPGWWNDLYPAKDL